jgi:hypothetical protein
MYHVEKTGGRSTARSILAAICERAGLEPEKCRQLADRVSRGRGKGKTMAGPYALCGPDACFSFKHATVAQRPFRDGWIHITQLREPMARIISHYRMILAGDQSPAWDMLAGERDPGNWLRFAQHAPPRILMRHLNMLSPKNLSVDEALESIDRMNHVLILEPGTYENGLHAFGSSLGLVIRPQHYGPSKDTTIEPEQLLADKRACEIVRERAKEEFELWDAVRRLLPVPPPAPPLPPPRFDMREERRRRRQEQYRKKRREQRRKPK